MNLKKLAEKVHVLLEQAEKQNQHPSEIEVCIHQKSIGSVSDAVFVSDISLVVDKKRNICIIYPEVSNKPSETTAIEKLRRVYEQRGWLEYEKDTTKPWHSITKMSENKNLNYTKD